MNQCAIYARVVWYTRKWGKQRGVTGVWYIYIPGGVSRYITKGVNISIYIYIYGSV